MEKGHIYILKILKNYIYTYLDVGTTAISS